MTRIVTARALRGKVLRLKWLVAATRFEITMHRHALALKVGFNPDQPRDEQGRWTDASSGQSTVGKPSGSVRERYRARGHHFLPRSLYKDLPLPPETRRVLDRATTGGIYVRGHLWDGPHRAYNQAVGELMNSYMARNGIHPERMTPYQAREMVSAIERSSDPRIREYNNGLRLLQRLFRLRIGGRGLE